MGRPKFNDWIKKNAASYNYEVGQIEAFDTAADQLLMALLDAITVEDVSELKKKMHDVVQGFRSQAKNAAKLAKSEWPFGLCGVEIKIPYGVEWCNNMLDENGYCDECGGEEA